jgi:signal transduction histidine kinase
LVERKGRSRLILWDDATILSREDETGVADRYVGDVSPARSLVARARALDRGRLNVLLAALVLVEGIAETALAGNGAAALRTGIAVSVGMGSAVLVRRRSAWACLVLAFGAFIVAGTDTTYTDDVMGPFLVLLTLQVYVGGRLPGRQFYAGLAAATALAALGFTTDGYSDKPSDIAFSLIMLVAAPMFLGRFLRGRADLNRALREKSERLERDREERARQAVAEERTRIASELHDAISHALSGMIVQAAGARRSLPAHPERARAAFAAVEDAGREALTEMRLLLGVLRREDAEIALAPQPSLHHLSSLVARVRADGLPVELAVEGEQTPLPAGLDLTAYRVVQEALANAAQDGGAQRARVRLRFAADRLDIEVADDGASGGGRELPGIRERLTIYGGELTDAREPGTGHVVRARLPLSSAVAA